VRHVLEIRSYNLKAGTFERFHRRFVEESLPLLLRHGIDVVAYGVSLESADTYFLMRRFASLEERRSSEDAFYASEQWRNGPREAVMADIESYTTVVLRIEEQTLGGLRTVLPATAP
jgi:NIPSNAP